MLKGNYYDGIQTDDLRFEMWHLTLLARTAKTFKS